MNRAWSGPVDLLLLLILSFVPGILWVWFFNRQDSSEREPVSLLARAFVLGMLSIVPAALVELPFRELLLHPPNTLARLILMILFVGFVEEFAKFAAFYLAVYRSEHFNEPVDGVIYAVTAGLGFAAVENMLYALSFGIEVAPVRAVVTSLAHASFSGLVGYYVAQVKLQGESWTFGLYGLVIATVLHGFYNWVIADQLFSPALAIPMVYIIYRFLAHKIRLAKTQSPFGSDE